MVNFNNILRKNFNSLLYAIKQMQKCDIALLPLMIMNILVDSIVPFISVVFPKYIIDELTIRKNLKNAIFLVVLFVVCDLTIKSINAVIDGVVNCKKEKLIQQHYRVFSNKTMSMDLEDIENPIISDQKTRAQQVITWNSRNIDGIKNAIVGIFSYLVQIVGYIYILSKLNVIVVFLIVAVVVINTFLNNITQKLIRKNDIELTPINREWKYLTNIVDDYSFGKLIRIYDFAGLIIDKCKNNRNKYKEKQLKTYKLNFISTIVLSSLSFFQEGFVYIFLTTRAVRGEITLGELTMYLSATMAFTNAVNNLIGFTIGLNYTSEYVNDFVKFINLPDSIEKTGNYVVENNNCSFEFRNVSFKYPLTEKYVLENVNIKFDSKEQIALVGENGTGKTTFVKLLMRFYEPTSGTILLNGKNIKEYDYVEYFSIFSTVFQDFQIFAFTVLENIALQTSEVKENEIKVIAALKEVGILDTIYSLPQKINTNLGKGFEEDGVELSGGEMQKIAIGRAIYKNAETYIMDEPTASLSPIAEYNIFKSFRNSTKENMVLYISHRLTSTAFSNRILVFKDGSIVEDGTHQELMNNKGFYAKMFTLQAAYYLNDEVTKTDE